VSLIRARVAVSAAFFLFGTGFGVWFVHIPIVKARLAIAHGVLGLALLTIGLGSVIAQPLAGYVISRVGSRPATIVLFLVFVATFAAPILAPILPMLFAAALLLGLAAGALNVAVNTQASEVEAARGRPTMSSFHGCFSLGGFAGALLGGYAISLGYSDGRGALVIAGAMFVMAVVICFGLPASRPTVSAGDKGPAFALPTSAILSLAGLAFICNALEGSVNDWSALYLATVRGLDQAAAGAGFAAFSATMAACRLLGGPVVARIGERAILVYGGLLAAAGFAFVTLTPWNSLTPAGFVLIAVGLANTLPIIISLGARAPGAAPSINVAAVATAALVGFLLGPPIIGFTAQWLGLGVAIAMLTAPALIVSVGASLRHWQAAT
jgi:MFS family permease